MNSEEAFRALRKQVNVEIKAVRKANQEYVQKNNFIEVRKLAEKGEKLVLLKEDLNRLNRKWRQYFPQGERLPGIEVKVVNTRGRRTPEEKFYIPILKALVERNGSGETALVVERVGEMMADVLNDFDREHLTTTQAERWKTTAKWARNRLRVMGLIISGTTDGNWEISDKGREYLKEQEE